MNLVDFLIMFSCGLFQSYSTHKDKKNIVKLSKLTETNKRFDGGLALEPPTINHVIICKELLLAWQLKASMNTYVIIDMQMF